MSAHMMTTLSRVVTAICLVVICSVASFSASWGIVIGVSDYADPSIRDLPYAAADAVAFAEALAYQCGVDPRNITLLVDSSATIHQISRAFGSLAEVAAEDDVVFIYFSGHGHYTIDRDGDEVDGDDLDEVLIPHDAIPGDDSSYIFDDTFGYWIARLSSESVVIVLDTCYSGGQGRSLEDNGSPKTVPKGTFVRDIFSDPQARRGRVLIAAAQATQTAHEDSFLQHGILTYYILEGLTHGAADHDSNGTIDIDELATYSVLKTEAWARGLGLVQQPIYENPTDHVFAVVPGPMWEESYEERTSGTGYYVMEGENPELFEYIANCISHELLLASGEEEARDMVYEELLAERVGEDRRFKVCTLDDLVPLDVIIDYNYAGESIVFGGHVVKLGPVIKILDMTVGTAYRVVYDLHPQCAPLIEYWYVDYRLLIHRSSYQQQ
ncbi:caspase domain-containing protein [Candidatus Bipolaricaulota bacterium]